MELDEEISARILEEQDEIRRNENLLYSWPLDDNLANSMQKNDSISSDDNADSAVSLRSPIPDIEDPNNKLTPRVLKISNGRESHSQQHRGTNNLFQLLVPSSQQAPFHSGLVHQIHLDRFNEDWKETRASLVCWDGDGRKDLKRISSIPKI